MKEQILQPHSNKNPENMEDFISRVITEAEKLEIQSNDKNEDGELLVYPDGPVSNLGRQSGLWWKVARTESFRKWFGDWQNDPKNSSKILDKNGEPLIVFRGLRSDISISDFYNNEFYQKEKSHALGKGVYTTPLMKESLNHIGVNENTKGGIFPMFLNSKKPHFQYTLSDKIRVNDFINKIVLFVPKKLIKNIPDVSIEGYDSVFSELADDSLSRVEEMSVINVKNPNQLFLLPNSISGNISS